MNKHYRTNSTLSDRLRESMAGSSLRSIAKDSSVSEGTLRNIMCGKIPRVDNLISIAKACGVRFDWLATGEGQASSSSQLAEKDGDKVEIPVLGVEVSAGHGSENGPERVTGSLAFRSQYLAARGLEPQYLRVVFAKGDSMEPEIQDGAAVLVNTADTKLDDGCIYIVRIDEHLFAKRVQRGFGELSLNSANSTYKAIEVPQNRLNELTVIGRVVWSGREH